MVKKNYVPERGDIIWLTFTPQAGHEQMGRRPAIVVSYKLYNEKTNLAIVCPITSKIKGYPFEVIIESRKINGAILADQLKNLDWKERQVEFIEKTDDEDIEEVIKKIKALII
ncbi:MAG: endoribonuclease MazF [Rectinemataceae bacterium]